MADPACTLQKNTVSSSWCLLHDDQPCTRSNTVSWRTIFENMCFVSWSFVCSFWAVWWPKKLLCVHMPIRPTFQTLKNISTRERSTYGKKVFFKKWCKITCFKVCMTIRKNICDYLMTFVFFRNRHSALSSNSWLVSIIVVAACYMVCRTLTDKPG